MELRKQQNIYESYIELCLVYSSKLNIPFEVTKETLLDTIQSRTTKKNHNQMFEKIHLQLKTNSKPYEESSRIQEIMKELCLI